MADTASATRKPGLVRRLLNLFNRNGHENGNGVAAATLPLSPQDAVRTLHEKLGLLEGQSLLGELGIAPGNATVEAVQAAFKDKLKAAADRQQEARLTRYRVEYSPTLADPKAIPAAELAQKNAIDEFRRWSEANRELAALLKQEGGYDALMAHHRGIEPQPAAHIANGNGHETVIAPPAAAEKPANHAILESLGIHPAATAAEIEAQYGARLLELEREYHTAEDAFFQIGKEANKQGIGVQKKGPNKGSLRPGAPEELVARYNTAQSAKENAMRQWRAHQGARDTLDAILKEMPGPDAMHSLNGDAFAAASEALRNGNGDHAHVNGTPSANGQTNGHLSEQTLNEVLDAIAPQAPNVSPDSPVSAHGAVERAPVAMPTAEIVPMAPEDYEARLNKIGDAAQGVRNKIKTLEGQTQRDEARLERLRNAEIELHNRMVDISDIQHSETRATHPPLPTLPEPPLTPPLSQSTAAAETHAAATPSVAGGGAEPPTPVEPPVQPAASHEAAPPVEPVPPVEHGTGGGRPPVEPPVRSHIASGDGGRRRPSYEPSRWERISEGASHMAGRGQQFANVAAALGTMMLFSAFARKHPVPDATPEAPKPHRITGEELGAWTHDYLTARNAMSERLRG